MAYIHVGFLLFANLLMRPRNDIPPRKPPPALPLIGSFLKEPRTWFVCLGCAFVMLGVRSITSVYQHIDLTTLTLRLEQMFIPVRRLLRRSSFKRVTHP